MRPKTVQLIHKVAQLVCTDPPETLAIDDGLNAERVEQFLCRFFDMHDLELMEVGKPVEKAASSKPASDRPATGKQFLDAFGTLGGAWFAQGRTFDQAKALYVEHLKAENQRLHATLGTKAGTLRTLASLGRRVNPDLFKKLAPKIGPNLARVAAGITFER